MGINLFIQNKQHVINTINSYVLAKRIYRKLKNGNNYSSTKEKMSKTGNNKDHVLF